MTDNIMIDLIHMANVAVAFVTLVLLQKKMFESKKVYGAFKVLLFVSLFLIYLLVVFIFDNPYINILYFIVSSQILCLFQYKASIKKSLIYNFLWITYMNLIDVMALIIVAYAFDTTIENTITDTRLYLICSLICILLIIFMYKASDILLASKESFTVRFNELIFVIFLVLFEFFLLYSITQLTRKNTWVLAVTALGFTVLDIYIFYMMGALAAGYKNRYELESIKIQNRIQLDHYEELNRKYAETRRMMHDIEKHITAIEKLAEDGSFSEANNYTKRLRGDLEKYKSIFECSNVILRAVLSQKISTAEAKDITVKTEIENLTLEFMEETDITSIFANLMDNAIEACEEVTNDKLISIKMCKINDIIFIDMANSYAGKLNKSDGILKTTKIGHMGYGIASIKMAVEKYNGYMTTESEDNKFISRILIPVP